MRRIAAALVMVVVATGVGLGVARATFVASERSVSIGAHDATIRPDFSSAVLLEAGPLLPQMRLGLDDSPMGIGVRINLGDAEAASLDEIITNDAVIASQPEGEIATVREAVRQMAVRSLLRGLGVAVLLAVALHLGWRSIGIERRRAWWRSWRQPTRRGVFTAAATGLVVTGSVALIAVSGPSKPVTTNQWLRAEEVFEALPKDPLFDRLELSDGAALRSGKSLIEGALRTYRESNDFYDKLATTAENVAVRVPEDGQISALVVTDRHDNVSMDPVARQIADNANAKLLIDLGDDTSNGASWERFSINSLAREFKGFDLVAVAGNHDQGPVIPKQMKRRGFELLSGEPRDIGGVRILGDSDPRSSGLTQGYTGEESDNIAAIAAQDKALTETACEDGSVAVLAVHSAASAKRAAASGCVDLVLSGHLHRQVGPKVVLSDQGDATVTLTTGTTGGAIYAFALGTGLRRQAQMTLVTFEDGRPVGLQLIDVQPGGEITAQEYVVLADLIQSAKAAPQGSEPSAEPIPEPEPEPSN